MIHYINWFRRKIVSGKLLTGIFRMKSVWVGSKTKTIYMIS